MRPLRWEGYPAEPHIIAYLKFSLTCKPDRALAWGNTQGSMNQFSAIFDIENEIARVSHLLRPYGL